ncbi:MAG TPA: hypothetical protein VKB25_03490 [Conexibacter sp.]|nr:hypothetical protein [Conexibacter sp.]
MTPQVLTPVETEREPLVSAADANALSELYREVPSHSTPEWCDLTPGVDLVPDDNDGFASVRIR